MTLLLLLICSVAIVVIAGTTRHDIRHIRREHAAKNHPYAKKWRARPLVSIVTPRAGYVVVAGYRKIEHVTRSKDARGDFIIFSPQPAVITKAHLLEGIYQLQDSSASRVALQHTLKQPQTLGQLLLNYHIIMRRPFEITRSGLSVDATKTGTVLYKNNPRAHSMRNTIYAIAAVSVKSSLYLLALYGFYAAVTLGQPQLFTVLLAGYITYVMLAVFSYAQLSLKQKFYYLLLAPIGPTAAVSAFRQRIILAIS